MRIPKFLEEGGCLGFVAPSFGCNIEPYKSAFGNALKKWQEMGFTVDIGPNCYEGKGIGISNTPEKCGKEIQEYFGEGRADVLISCGGGELMCEILDFVDFEKLAKETPKWYMGYSDNTNLTFLLATLCDTASVYGPCAAAFGMEPWHPSLTDAMELLMGRRREIRGYDLWEKESLKDEEHPLLPYNVTEKRIIRAVPEGSHRLEGRMLGGCLDCLHNLVGTRYDNVAEFNKRYGNEGIIWYLEACDFNVMGIRRALWNLEHAGWFDCAAGFLIGRPLCFGEEFLGLDHYEAVLGVLRNHNVPVIMDVDIGHLPPMMPVVNGAYAVVEQKGNDIRITYDWDRDACC